MDRRPQVTFVIMAGGKGERLWPLVRSGTPKVCASPGGTRTLLAATIERLRMIWPGAGWLIVTTQGQAEAVRSCVPASLRRAVLVEPTGKNTAACITLAAVALANRQPRRVMVAVPADHWVGHVAAYRRAVRTAIRAAVRFDTLATIGVRPTKPHVGLGYLCAGAPLPDGRRRAATRSRRAPQGTPVFRLARFIEKPSVASARRLLHRPRTYWNSGTFIGTADKFLERITEWLPDHARRLAPLAATLRRGSGRRDGPSPAAFTRRAATAYRALEAVSFDRGVMDHLHDGIVVEGRFPWADLGSWDAWACLGNAAARTIMVNSRNVTVVGQPGHVVAAIGVRDLLIVQTTSATLVCRSNQAQAVRDVVKRIAADPRLAAYR